MKMSTLERLDSGDEGLGLNRRRRTKGSLQEAEVAWVGAGEGAIRWEFGVTGNVAAGGNCGAGIGSAGYGSVSASVLISGVLLSPGVFELVDMRFPQINR